MRITHRNCRSSPRSRHGGVLVWFAVLFVVLLGMVGLAVDGGLLLSTHRQAQNAADAASLAAAMDLMRSKTNMQATETATTFVQTYNGLADAPAPVVNIPPESGPYAGNENYVEVIVTAPTNTFFIQVLGAESSRSVRARAVAGFEARSASEAVMVLDPSARPGLNVGGGGQIRVVGRIVVNSDGGGEDEFGETVPGTQTAASVGGSNNNLATGIYADEISVVGGVNDRDKFRYIDPNITDPPTPLKARSLSESDPLINLPTPNESNGVDPTRRGEVVVNNNNAQGLQQEGTADFSLGTNFRVPSIPPPDYDLNPTGLHTLVPGEVVLFPGIYDSLTINGGNVYMVPGIYVISPQMNSPNVLSITGGNVTGEHIMFYNTSRSYDPNTGSPDLGDGSDRSPLSNAEYNGSVSINASMNFTPIDTADPDFSYGPLLYNGGVAVSPEFDGMLFYQRRRNTSVMTITGNAGSGVLAGTLYAKWALVNISGQGTYDAQFIVGSMSVTGGGDVTVLGLGTDRGKANQVFLVE